MKRKKAVVGTAQKNELHYKPYRKPLTLSSTKNKLLVEIGGLVGALDNPFLSQAERETCEVLFYSTVRKLNVLQNGYYSGCGCVDSTNSEKPE